jgi:hypothetical protein
MTILSEAANALQGSLMLLARRSDAFARFNLTSDGFWRSFAAILVIAPLYLYAARVDALYPAQGGEPLAYTPVVSLITLAIEWVAWPVAVALVTFRTRYSGFFARYVIVYNWSSIAVVVVMVMPLVGLDAGFIGVDQATMAAAVLLIVALWYRWLVARLALEAPGLVALGLVGGDVVLSLAIHRLISG